MMWAAVAVVLLQIGAAKAEVRVDDKAARAVLAALGDPALTKTDALTIAQLPGNQALVRKLVSFGVAADDDGFAEALVAAAHGDEKATPYGFVRVKRDRLTTLKLLDDIDAHPDQFVGWIENRITPFMPPGITVEAAGYLIAGGSADGFSFDKPDFFMNISRFGDEIGSARVIMAHELYHGVQNLAARRTKAANQAFGFEASDYSALTTGLARDCYATRAYFSSLVAEGTATFVGDPDLLPKDGAYANAERQRRIGRNSDLSRQRTLLDMSLRVISGPEPMSEESVYAVGFYNDALMYDVGYAMTKAIAKADGEAAIGRLIALPPETFVRRYIELSKLDPKLPKLGPTAAHWAARRECAR